MTPTRKTPDPAAHRTDADAAAPKASTRRKGSRPARGEKQDDSPLESLGKAVSEPVRDAADEDADEKP